MQRSELMFWLQRRWHLFVLVTGVVLCFIMIADRVNLVHEANMQAERLLDALKSNDALSPTIKPESQQTIEDDGAYHE